MGLFRSKFAQAVLVLVAAFLVFRFGIRPPMPFSLLSLYMAITLLAVLVYVSSDSDSWRAFVAPVWATLTEPRYRPVRLGLGVIVPLLAGYYAFSQAVPRVEAPVELRAIHPAPPDAIRFRGKTVNLQDPNTPVRRDVAANPATRARHLAAGGAVYVRNCVYCHGDQLDGRGHFAHGFNPQPADFTDPGTIAQLSEGFLFWRIAKGGPGLPRESTPWNSAMPAWEDRLTEEEIWQVIYYLYETVGVPPRVMTAGPAGAPGPPRPGAVAARVRRALDGLATGVRALAARGAGLAGPRAVSAQAAAGDLERGRALYEAKCALCHGLSGKGDGPAAELLVPRPRDFTAGKYKIRSTTGPLPSDEDLARVIREGMPGTSMPAWGRIITDARDLRALVAYIKSFAPAFREARAEPAPVPPEVAASEASVRRGRELFEAIECHKCHGQAGRGDPAPGSDLTDDWGQPIRPANLTKPWTFRGGPARRDVVLRLLTGLAGTPMPTFAGVVQDYREFKKQESEEKKDPRIWETWKDASLWDVANYVRSLGPDRPQWASLLAVRPAAGDVPSDPDAEFWRRVPPAHFPLVGQVIVDPRNFNPTVDMITVRAVHTSGEVVFHLTWDDPTPSDAGRGAPRSDAVALQFPSRGATERPYFLMGDAARPVYLLTWTAGRGVGEATAAGAGKITPQPAEAVQATGRAVYDAGQYRVVVRRPRETGDRLDFAFPASDFFPIAFWVWDGDAGEEGPRAAISTWYHVRLEAPPSARRFVVPPLVALAVAGLEWGLARWARGRPRG